MKAAGRRINCGAEFLDFSIPKLRVLMDSEAKSGAKMDTFEKWGTWLPTLRFHRYCLAEIAVLIQPICGFLETFLALCHM